MTSVSSTTSSSSTTTSATSSAALSEDLDTFLYLLTTQLQNQDPLDPMDTAEFTNQLVQYANVEQSIQINENLESMLSYDKASLGTMAVNYIGNTIQALSNYVPLQDGAAKFTYTLDEEATSCVVALSDADGNIIKAFTGEKSAGTHTVEWDGYDDDGNKLDDGGYSLTVTAMGEDGTLDVYTTVYGKATAVANEDDGVYMALGDVIIHMDNIIAVREYEPIVFDDDTEDTTTTDDSTTTTTTDDSTTTTTDDSTTTTDDSTTTTDDSTTTTTDTTDDSTTTSDT
ncbi:MAG: flagellar hook assembly protein FlgD [Alphaproteobacteria bacterium]